MTTPKRPRGRPPGKHASEERVQFTMSADELEDLDTVRFIDPEQPPRAVMIRRAIREMIDRSKVAT